MVVEKQRLAEDKSTREEMAEASARRLAAASDEETKKESRRVRALEDSEDEDKLQVGGVGASKESADKDVVEISDGESGGLPPPEGEPDTFVSFMSALAGEANFNTLTPGDGKVESEEAASPRVSNSLPDSSPSSPKPQETKQNFIPIKAPGFRNAQMPPPLPKAPASAVSSSHTKPGAEKNEEKSSKLSRFLPPLPPLQPLQTTLVERTWSKPSPKSTAVADEDDLNPFGAPKAKKARSVALHPDIVQHLRTEQESVQNHNWNS